MRAMITDRRMADLRRLRDRIIRIKLRAVATASDALYIEADSANRDINNIIGEIEDEERDIEEELSRIDPRDIPSVAGTDEPDFDMVEDYLYENRRDMDYERHHRDRHNAEIRPVDGCRTCDRIVDSLRREIKGKIGV